MFDYYSENLSAERLRTVYEIAPPRIQQYLNAEIQFVLENISSGDAVLELGCGYGRALSNFARKEGTAVGIDSSYPSLAMGREMFGADLSFIGADAVTLPFYDESFDCVVCIQNGISAFHVDRRELIAEAVRVARPGGKAIFSSYSDAFWEVRLKWCHRQADRGLLGEIDDNKTGDGDIVCKDGFTATTIREEDFRTLTNDLRLNATITEIDSSSIFCIIEKEG